MSKWFFGKLFLKSGNTSVYILCLHNWDLSFKIWRGNWCFSIWCRKRTLLITIIGKNQSKSQEITWFCPFFNGNLRNCHQLPTLTPWFTFSFLCKVRVNKVFQIFTWKEKKTSYIFPFFQLTNIKNSPNRTCNRIRIHKNRSQGWL